jgi:hypothetical protein
MLPPWSGLSMLLALVGGTPPWPAACSAAGCGLARPAGIPAGRRPGADPPGPAVGRRVAAAGPDPRPGLPGPVDPPAPLPTREFVATTRASPPPSRPSPARAWPTTSAPPAYLADTWGCVSVRAEQQGRADPATRAAPRPAAGAGPDRPAGTAPASWTAWWLGWAEDGSWSWSGWPRSPARWSAGLAGFGKTMLVAHLLGQLAPSPAVQFVPHRRQGRPRLRPAIPRAWLSAKDDLDRSATCSARSIG